MADAKGTADSKAKAKAKDAEKKRKALDNIPAQYALTAALIQSDKTGSLAVFAKRYRDYINEHGNAPTEYQLKQWAGETEWFQNHNAAQQAALKAQNDPLLAKDYQDSVDRLKGRIQNAAERYGVPLDDATLSELARQGRYDNWDDYEIQNHLAPLLATAASAGTDLSGQAGDAQSTLKQWLDSNGINLPDSAISQFVERFAFGKQSIDDIKDEIRKTYMTGYFPAWADKINQGLDPSALAGPYRDTISKLLEVDEGSVGFDDPLLKRAMQGIGPDGKPAVIPMYEFERMVREDPRWDKTNNAYETYANIGTGILRTFGFG